MPKRAKGIFKGFQFKGWCVRCGLRWSIISSFMKTRIAQVAATIPLIGYALLWSEEIKKYLQLQSALGGGLWFAPTSRLLLVYFGAILLTLAWAIYGIWCPPMIKRMTDVSDYLLSELQTSNRLEFKRIQVLVTAKRRVISETPRKIEWMADLAPLTLTEQISATALDKALHRLQTSTPSPIEDKSLVLQAWYLSNEGVKFPAQVAAIACVGIGTTFVMLPSIEVFCAVVLRIVLPGMGFR